MIKQTITALFCAISLTASAQSFETATASIQNMKVGWNLGNTLDANSGERMTDVVKSETYWGQPVTKKALMTMLKEAGFNAVRIPVTWFPHMNDANVVDAEWMARVKEVVDYVIDSGMYCILNVHHDTGDGDTHWLHASTEIFNQQKAKFESLWQQIANEFKDYDQRLLFEGYNEMLDKYNSWCFASFASSGGYNATDAADAYDAINSYAQLFVNTVRNTGGNNTQRNLVVNTYAACDGRGTWNSHLLDPLKEMKMPDDPSGSGHIAFQVHCYPNVENITSTKSEVDLLMENLKNYLQSKGGPVIIGEWGTESSDDYMNLRENSLEFARYLVQKAKEYGFGTYRWMGLTSGSTRSFPAFSEPDLAQAIVTGYYGSTDGFQYPTIDDYDILYTVDYNPSWTELNLYSGATLNVSQYKAIKVEFAEDVPANALKIKVYGADNKTQYSASNLSGSTGELTFNSTTLGGSFSRITLQNMTTSAQQATIKKIYLIKQDGEQVVCEPSAFWGCTVTTTATRKPTGIATPRLDKTLTQHNSASPVYDLGGRKINHPVRGLYVRDGRKYVVR